MESEGEKVGGRQGDDPKKQHGNDEHGCTRIRGHTRRRGRIGTTHRKAA